MATDPRILSSLVKPDVKDDQTRETTLNIEEDLGVLGSDTPETDDERDLAVSPSQDKGRDGDIPALAYDHFAQPQGMDRPGRS